MVMEEAWQSWRRQAGGRISRAELHQILSPMSGHMVDMGLCNSVPIHEVTVIAIWNALDAVTAIFHTMAALSSRQFRLDCPLYLKVFGLFRKANK